MNLIWEETIRVYKMLVALLGFGTVNSGLICEVSTYGTLDFHDYPHSKGGDDIPTHFHEYTCWKCGKKFVI